MKHQIVTEAAPTKQSGALLIEVLITIVILVFGLLGLAGLQARSLTAEMESYQRAQALVIAQDMSSRIQSHRKLAADYVIGDPTSDFVGDSATGACSGSAISDCDDWEDLLAGAVETDASGNNVGAMIGARGCISESTGIYTIAVSWQGVSSTTAPTVDCANDNYTNEAGTIDETRRRTISIRFRIADLNS